MNTLPVSLVTNEDCMNMMKRYPDGYFDLAVIDPPFGLGHDRALGSGCLAKASSFEKKNWDKEPPQKKYFEELKRVSKNQIIFGANHFISKIPLNSSCWLVWDKKNGDNDFADCELAWTSFKTSVRKFSYRWQGMLQENMKNKEFKIHPTQKPIALYNWIFNNYAQKGGKILDTHLGSGSSRIAAYKAKLDFYGCELDKDYYDKQEDRFKNFVAQLTLW